jgi:hypothetical protein
MAHSFLFFRFAPAFEVSECHNLFAVVLLLVSHIHFGCYRGFYMFSEGSVGVSRPGGSLDRRVKMSPRVPAQMGRRETEHEVGKKRQPEREREVEIPRPSCLSRAQVGCACSRGLQASTRERERAASRERLSRPLPRAANPL